VQDDLHNILVTRESIALRVRELGAELARDLETSLAGSDARVVLIPVMTGALVFAADLIRELPLKLRLGLVAVSSYPGTSMTSKGARLESELPHDLAGAHVIVVDDILDSGQTLAMVREIIQAQNPASLRICVLLKKPKSARKREVEAEFVGFEIPDEFVVGYGLDFDGHYRNLPYIATLRADIARAARAAPGSPQTRPAAARKP
jgi:hypoxanthine phosphoribosyltransferase